MNWKFSGDRPVYQQIISLIRGAILRGELPPGGKVPSVRDLAEEIGINMHTVNKAYATLRQEGYLTLDRRRGAVIAVNNDKLRAIEQLKQEMRISLAKALCRGLSEEEIHAAADEVLQEFESE